MAIAADIFTTVRSEGALLPPDLLRRIVEADGQLEGVTPAAYHLDEGEKLNEAVNRSWNRLLGVWKIFREAANKLPATELGTSLTRERWLLPLFSELGYGRLPTARGLVAGGQEYPISHLWNLTPMHLVGFRVDQDRRMAGVAGAARMSPYGLVQDFLNRSEAHVWGLVSNGLKLRLLRDSATLVRQSFVEFDLESMFDGQVYADFVLLWLVCHESRVEAERAEDYWLERWCRAAEAQGTRALDRLRDGVQAAITHLGQGFLHERRNHALRAALRDGTLPPQEYYRELLRVIYRMLFLFIAEDKDLLFARTTPEQARSRYRRFYSMTRLRRLAERRPGARHLDLWRGLSLIWDRVYNETGYPELGLPPLNGFLWSPAATAHLNGADLANLDLLDAVRALAFTRHDDVRRPVDFRNMGPEELGSVYESLLELQPELNADAGSFRLLETGTERRATGSHYTPTPILKRVLDFALTPQIERCLKAPDPAAALLDLRILDPACGSGHFLIAAAHRIARPLASVRTGEMEPSPEHVHTAFRDVIARCVYGVDYNPMAVELCKVALWIETFEPGKPLSFLDHHIRCGNSLIGVPLGTTVARNRTAVEARRAELRTDIERVAQKALELRDMVAAQSAGEELKELKKELVNTTYNSWADGIPGQAFKAVVDDDREVAKKAAAANKRAWKTRQMEIGFGPVEVTLPPELVAQLDAIGVGAEATVAEVTVRAARYEEAVRHLAYLHALELADTWTAAWFWPLRAGEPLAPTQGYYMTLQGQAGSLPEAMAAHVQKETGARRFFHCELAFPEVFTTARGGFDVVIGNPPYVGGIKISGAYGDRFLKFLKGVYPAPTGGREDLASFFLRRGCDLLRDGGDLCYITTNTIAQGDTRKAGLDLVAAWGSTIANAIRSEPWPGTATVAVAIVHLHRGPWDARRTVDGVEVSRIGTDLGSDEHASQPPRRLIGNLEIASKGTDVLGDGFFLTGGQHAALLDDDPDSAGVVKPMMGASEVMNSSSLAPTRWIISFGEMTEEQAAQYRSAFRLVEERVKPQRQRQRTASLRNRWWVFNRTRSDFYGRIAAKGLRRIIAIPEVSKTMMPVMVPADVVYLHTLALVASEDLAMLATLCSSFHWLWSAKYCSTMRSDPRYSLAACFATYPLPDMTPELRAVGAELDDARHQLMNVRSIGVTDVYNLVNDPSLEEAAVRRLRCAHERIDRAVAEAYGWAELEPQLVLGHYPTQRFGIRWTLQPAMQREVERRMLTLNLQRAADTGVVDQEVDPDVEPEAVGAS